MNARIALMAIVVLATVIRLGVTLSSDPRGWLYSDMAVYDRVAQHWQHLELSPDDTFTPAGYPVFLAAIYTVLGRSLVVVGVVQALLGGLTCLLAARLARDLSGSDAAAAVTAAVIAFYPPLIYYGALLLTEAVAPLWTTLSVWLLIRSVRRRTMADAALAGLVISIATLTRPNLLLTFLWIPIFVWVASRPSLSTAVRTMAGIAAAAAPLLIGAAAINSYQLGRPAGLSTNGGLNFFLMQADVHTVLSPNGGWTPIRNLLYYSEVHRAPVPTYEESYFYREGLARLRKRTDTANHFVRNLREGFGLGAQGYWPANGGLIDEHQSNPTLRRVLRMSSQAFFWLLVLPVAIEIAIAMARRRLLDPGSASLWLAFAILFGIAVTSVTFLADPRMHVPFHAVLVAYVVAFAARTAKAIQGMTEAPLTPAR